MIVYSVYPVSKKLLKKLCSFQICEDYTYLRAKDIERFLYSSSSRVNFVDTEYQFYDDNGEIMVEEAVFLDSDSAEEKDFNYKYTANYVHKLKETKEVIHHDR